VGQALATSFEQVDGDPPRLLGGHDLGDVALGASGRVVRPVLGQVEPPVQGRIPAGGGVGEEDAELAVVLLAQPAAPLPGHPARLGPRLGEAAGVEDQDRVGVAEHLAGVAAELGHDGLVVPPAGADEVLDRLAVDAGLDRDRLAGLSPQPTEQAADDEGGVGPLLGAVEARQIASQEGRDPVLTAADPVGGHDGIGQEGLGVGVFQERHGGPSRRISSAADHNPRLINAIVETVTVQLGVCPSIAFGP
jgi:hypothetical protein